MVCVWEIPHKSVGTVNGELSCKIHFWYLFLSVIFCTVFIQFIVLTIFGLLIIFVVFPNQKFCSAMKTP